MYLAIFAEWAADYFGLAWFDVNRPTFDEDMHEKSFFYLS